MGTGVVFHNLQNQGGHGLRVERFVSGQHLVQNHTHGKKVGAGIYRFPSCLLRRHIARRPQYRADLGAFAGRRICQTGNTEIRDLHRFKI